MERLELHWKMVEVPSEIVYILDMNASIYFENFMSKPESKIVFLHDYNRLLKA